MDEHKKFLADRLLSEERPITYRVLSRAMDVHVNTAKDMLYGFHKEQNTLRANSIYATYLIYGTREPPSADQNGDVEMTSSAPEHESLSDQVLTETMTLVGEDELKDVLKEYTKVTSIHMYSLAPQQKDLTALSDIAKSISEYKVEGDSSAASKKYGTIFNAHVRRRDRKTPASIPASAAKSVTQEPKPAKQEPPRIISAQPSNVKSEPSQESTKSAPRSSIPTKNAAPVKRGSTGGGIMQSFAKASAKPPKPKPVAKEEDTAMALSDDGEADDDDIASSKKPAADFQIGKTRKERQEELRRMMEEDDSEEDEADDRADEEMEDAAEPDPEPESEAIPEENAKEPEDKEPAEVVSSTGDGRRRGKRRVMKKKRILDDQGYMVTIQEPGWESFSEDDVAPPAKRQTPAPTPASSAPKAKKPASNKASQGSQGNIMSFFSKK